MVSGSLPDDDRWRGLGAHLPTGIGQTLAVPIRLLDEVAGTLTAYAPREVTLEESTLLILAQTLGGVLHEVQLLDELADLQRDMECALASRAVIEQAKGMIMASRRIGPDAAWEHLLRLSSSQERKLREVARDIVAGAETAH